MYDAQFNELPIAVGEEWDDKQYQNLGAVIDQAVAALSSNYATLSECTTRLQVLKRILEDYLSHLFKRCDICGLWFQEEFYHQPLTGLAHGQSGYALALSKALPYINEGILCYDIWASTRRYYCKIIIICKDK